jgi:integrase
MLFGIETGARLSELTGITWQVTDLENGLLAVQAQLARENGQWVLRALKTGKSERIKILSPEAIAALKVERARQAIGAYPNPLGLALLNEEGRPWDSTHANIRIKAICKLAGVREFPSHTLFRHTYATALLKSGVSLHDASREMGHSSVNLTANLYGHHAMESTRKAAASRNAFLEQTRTQSRKKPDSVGDSG